MFCYNCGKPLPHGAAFCANCGAQISAQSAPHQTAYSVPPHNSYSAPVAVPAREQEDPELNSLGRTIMILGIVGLATGINFGIPGIIVSNIAMSKAAEFERKAGSLYGKAKLGRNLAKPGKILGIVMTILWIFIIIFYGVCYGLLLSDILY